jgi:hypothetical protein
MRRVAWSSQCSQEPAGICRCLHSERAGGDWRRGSESGQEAGRGDPRFDPAPGAPFAGYPVPSQIDPACGGQAEYTNYSSLSHSYSALCAGVRLWSGTKGGAYTVTIVHFSLPDPRAGG